LTPPATAQPLSAEAVASALAEVEPARAALRELERAQLQWLEELGAEFDRRTQLTGTIGIFLLFAFMALAAALAWALHRRLRTETMLSRDKAALEQEVRQRQETERALRDATERFRDFTELSSDWYWEQDADLRGAGIPRRQPHPPACPRADLPGEPRRSHGAGQPPSKASLPAAQASRQPPGPSRSLLNCRLRQRRHPMSDPLLDSLQLGPRGQAAASVIWLHGLGADGHDFQPIVPELGLPDSVRFIFPHAPIRPVTLNGGLPMRAWYDILSLGEPRTEDDVGIRNSERQVRRLIEREASHGVTPERIVLAGFSQGGAIALHAGLRYPQRLAGIMALSTYLPLAASLEGERSPANADTPVFMAHGRFDQIVVAAYGQRSREYLEALGQPVEWRDYPMEHSVSIEEIRDIADWLRKSLALG
jgi:phospholipase/carboxylesterase